MSSGVLLFTWNGLGPLLPAYAPKAQYHLVRFMYIIPFKLLSKERINQVWLSFIRRELIWLKTYMDYWKDGDRGAQFRALPPPHPPNTHTHLHPTSRNISNRSKDHFLWLERKISIFYWIEVTKLKLFHLSRTNTARLCKLGHFEEVGRDYLYSFD